MRSKKFSSISSYFKRKELFYVLVVCMLYVKAKVSPDAGVTFVNFYSHQFVLHFR